jgi:hypothetical protein
MKLLIHMEKLNRRDSFFTEIMALFGNKKKLVFSINMHCEKNINISVLSN